jgi:hypothetical protein
MYHVEMVLASKRSPTFAKPYCIIVLSLAVNGDAREHCRKSAAVAAVIKKVCISEVTYMYLREDVN